MKPSPFEYLCPDRIGQVAELLAAHPDARILAGGQSLMPLLALRMTNPSHVIDINRIAGLNAIDVDGTHVRLGALVRWCDIEKSLTLGREHPLLVHAISHVAHYQIRNLGTVGGGLAHADPASEMACVAVSSGAELVLLGQAGERVVDIEDFLIGPLTTDLRADEIITQVRLPRWKAGRRWAFREFSRRSGDYALAGVALHYDQDLGGRLESPRIAVFGGLERATRLRETETLLTGRILNDGLIGRASALAAKEIILPADLRVPEKYRRQLFGMLVEKALRESADRQLVSEDER